MAYAINRKLIAMETKLPGFDFIASFPLKLSFIGIPNKSQVSKLDSANFINEIRFFFVCLFATDSGTDIVKFNYFF
jgi:hypothetical protein